NAVAAAVTYDDPTRTATLNPTADLAAGATYTATVTGAKDAAGNTMAGSTTWSFTTSATTCPCTIWPSTATPVNASEPDGSAVELGVKFQADQAGTITGVRFYKGSGNTGTHIGNLWSSTGTRLATVTFANETATGWQQMNFSAPVAVTAGTTYVASYFAPAGVYAADGNYFATAGVDRPPLHALANGSSGGNGVYLYGASSAFPNQTYQSTNYWVDVVFVPNGPDTTPPAISSVSAIPGGTSAVVTWTTNEVSNSRVDYGTDSASLASSVSDATMVTSHSVTLNGLAPATTYFFRVTSADAAGNPATSPAPPGAPATFATPQPSLGDNTTADFAAGTLGTYAYLAQTADGEVALAPADGGEFSSGLPAGWATTAIQTGGTATVSGGKVTVDGARIAPTPTYAAGRSLEFSATFSGQAGQSVGFGLTLNESPWAMFGTNGGGSLYARSRLNNSNTNTNLGASLLGSAHRFRIDWNATNIVFSVDGVVKATHSRTISVAMRPVVRENTVGGGSVVVDWLRMTPYSSPGTFTSRLIDAGAPVPWTTAVWTADLPAGTSLTVSVTTGNSQDPNDGTWTALTPLAGSGATVGTTARYLQYRLTLSTTAGGQTPALRDITFSHG
ncbi:MAG TPA: DUF4082 domain-containing protein, partial [Acidimicrobiales bacterium]|nr:DUF4082 domain-containing protein [Acidimicrobiales bacterium]